MLRGWWNDLARRHPLDLGGGSEAAVLVAGAGRSGTTWLTEMINYRNEYRVIFEPFHAWKIPESGVFVNNWYVPRGSEPPEGLRACVDRIVSGRLRNGWSDGHNRRFVARRRLIKGIRCHLMLSWLRERYPRMPIILLVRHPCAVAVSRLRLSSGWEWRPALDDLMGQRDLAEGPMAPFQDLIDKREGPFEEAIILWCVQHLIPLRELGAEEYLLAFYERLVSRPEQEFRRIFTYLRIPWDDRCLHQVRIPSRSRRVGLEQHGLTPDIGRWESILTSGQRDWAAAMVDRFGLSDLYGGESVPRPVAGHSEAAAEP